MDKRGGTGDGSHTDGDDVRFDEAKHVKNRISRICVPTRGINEHFDGIVAVGLQQQELFDQLLGHFLIDSSGEEDCPGLEQFDLQALRNILSGFIIFIFIIRIDHVFHLTRGPTLSERQLK